MENKNNYAFIDSQNLNLGVKSQGWNLDFAGFRQFLKDKYEVEKAVIVSGDGDFYCLIEYLAKQNKLRKIIVPNIRFSSLLRKFSNFIVSIQLFRGKLTK